MRPHFGRSRRLDVEITEWLRVGALLMRPLDLMRAREKSFRVAPSFLLNHKFEIENSYDQWNGSLQFPQ